MPRKTTTTSRADPWAPTQGGLRTGISDLTNLYESGGLQITPYQGDWVADATQATTDAQAGILGLTDNLSGAASGAMSVLNNITDPGAFDAQRQAVIESIMPSINSSFAGSGMTGSSLHQQNLAKGLASGMADAEKGFMQTQMQAAGMVPGMMNAQLQPYQAAMGVGQQQQAQNQAEIDATIQKDMMTQGAEGQAIRDLLSILSGVGGQFGTQTQTQKQSPGLLDVLGGGLQLGSMF